MAFQLTNIARDVGGDLSTGRVYLPREWLRDAGATLVPWRPLDAYSAGAIVPVVARLLDEADRFYLSAWHGVGRLPWRSAWAVAAARHIYRDIGVEVRRRGPAAWSDRVTTSRARKSGRLMQALGEAVWATSVGQMGTAPSRDALWTPPRGSMLG